MSNRLFLKDYTPDEIRAMPAGALLDWLAWQGMGRAIEVTKEIAFLGNIIYVMEWYLFKPSPAYTDGPSASLKISSDPGAAMRALEWLGKDDLCVSVKLWLDTAAIGEPMWDTHIAYLCSAPMLRPAIDVEDLLTSAATPALAIARAVALYGLATIATKGSPK